MTYPPTKPPKAALRVMRQDRAHALGTTIIKLTCVEVALIALEDVFKDDKAHAAHLKKIRRWLESCWRTAGQGQRRKLSAALLRRVDDESAMVDAARLSVVGREWTVPAWASWLVCLDALIHDVICTWPGGHAACWRYLGQTWETLARRFLAGAGGGAGQAEADGWEIYEQIVEVTGWA